MDQPHDELVYLRRDVACVSRELHDGETLAQVLAAVKAGI